MFDENQYVTNKNNNAVNLQKNADGSYTIVYTNTGEDGSAVSSSQIVNMSDLLNQQTTFQNNLTNLQIVIQDLRSLG